MGTSESFEATPADNSEAGFDGDDDYGTMVRVIRRHYVSVALAIWWHHVKPAGRRLPLAVRSVNQRRQALEGSTQPAKARIDAVKRTRGVAVLWVRCCCSGGSAPARAVGNRRASSITRQAPADAVYDTRRLVR